MTVWVCPMDDFKNRNRNHNPRPYQILKESGNKTDAAMDTWRSQIHIIPQSSSTWYNYEDCTIKISSGLWLSEKHTICLCLQLDNLWQLIFTTPRKMQIYSPKPNATSQHHWKFLTFWWKWGNRLMLYHLAQPFMCYCFKYGLEKVVIL